MSKSLRSGGITQISLEGVGEIDLAKTIVVIPTMNEEKHIGDVVKRSRKYVKTVIVVDDGSTDKTAEFA